MTPHFFSRRGFSLIEILMVGCIVGIIGYALTQMFSSFQSGQSQAVYTLEFNNRLREVGQLLNENSLCGNAFRQADGTSRAKFGVGVTTNLLALIARDVGASRIDVLKVGETLGSAMRLTTLAFRYQRDSAGAEVAPQVGIPTAGVTTHFVELVAEASRTDGGAKPPINNKTKPIRLVIITDNATNEVTGCEGTASSSGIQLSQVTRIRTNPVAATGTVQYDGRYYLVAQPGSLLSSVVVLNRTLPDPLRHNADPDDFDGIKCNDGLGWRIVGCSGGYDGNNEDVCPYPNGCVSNDLRGGGYMTITCMKVW